MIQLEINIAVKPPLSIFLILCSLSTLMLHWAAAKLLEVHIELLYTPMLNDVPGRKEHTISSVI